ncbi:hypothetical protein [Massilia sp. DD77]|uniref:hypothetical protein n=1 Tax=Massilia sp. DD77 TaxID=3109349 RepID=UPI002FFEA54E
MGFQSMQSVAVKDDVMDEDGDVLLSAGQAGYVVADKSVVVNGVSEGEVDVKMDHDGIVYSLDVSHIRAL